ncbi:MAG: zinc ribbon domain-containing protein [Armatimonadetes bacterium]|nr:zinc ribbon domain-containing protein [Armatimonadota bacterium]
MPTYVYECSACDKTFEVDQRITEDPLKDCGCGAKGTVKRLIQPTAVMFRGSGFHINDYSGSSAPKAEAKKADDTKKDAPASGPCGPSCPCAPESGP